MKKRNTSFEDLEVYQKLCNLHIEIHKLTMKFPEIEVYEIGYNLRKLSNSAPANVAVGWSNKHFKKNTDGFNRAFGDIRQTKHYLSIALRKSYIDNALYDKFMCEYDECEKLLTSLEKSINKSKSRNSMFTKNQYPGAYSP